MNNEDVKTHLRIFRHESLPGEPTVHKDTLLKELAKALGYKVYDGFESDIRTCIKENKTEDEIINCIKMKLKRRFEPEKGVVDQIVAAIPLVLGAPADQSVS